MPYSAVIQPSPLPLRNDGTPDSTLTVQITFVWPKLMSAEPSAWALNPRSMVTTRSSSAALPECLCPSLFRFNRLPLHQYGWSIILTHRPQIRLFMTSSMTGYFSLVDQGLSCEVRSVNHRFLEISVRAPEGLRYLEPIIRRQCKASLGRGKVDWTIRSTGESETALAVDTAKLAEIADALETISQVIPSTQPPSLTDLLAWPGVAHTPTTAPDPHLIETFIDQVLNGLIQARQAEGEALHAILLDKLDALNHHVATIKSETARLIERQTERLRDRFQSLQVDVEPERLHQEIVLLVQKNDIGEELDRLSTHIDAFTVQLNQGGSSKESVGKRLDFLVQELNRETNTIASKSWDSALTLLAVEMKVLIEQLREQIQNVE